MQQSIYGISGGNVTSLSHEEYIVHTFAGSILSFTAGTHTLAAVPAAAMQAADAQPPDKERQERLSAEVKAFEAEVRNLTKQVEVRAPGDLRTSRVCKCCATACSSVRQPPHELAPAPAHHHPRRR